MTDDGISQSQCEVNSAAGATPAKTLVKLILLSASIGLNCGVKFSTNHKYANVFSKHFRKCVTYDESWFINSILIRNFKFHSCFMDGQKVSQPSGYSQRERPDVHGSTTLQLLVYFVPFFTSTQAEQS